MSKRKGRKPARSSEIKSVLRAPPEGEKELEGGAAADGESDSLPLDVLAEVIEPEPALANEPEERAAESEPAPPVESARAPRARRLHAVRADETEALEGARDDDEAPAPDGEAEEPSARADDDDELGESDAEASADEAGADEGFPPFPIEADGDDTEGFLRGLIEALLFTSQKPLELKDLARSAGVDKPRAKELLEQLMASYAGRGLCVEQVAGGFVMRSSARYAPYIQKILALRPVRLSRAQLETLAIVAYRQPVTKPEVDDIRGVDSGQVIKGLLERSLLKMLGKKDEPGRPTLYGTTSDFLELLNLQSLKDLPTLREYTELSEESQRKFLDETGEAPPSGAISFERPAAPAEEGTGSDADEAAPGAEATLEPGEEAAPAEPAGDRDDASSPLGSEEPSEPLETAAAEDATAAESEEEVDETPSAASEGEDSDEDDDDEDDDDEEESDDSDEDDGDEDSDEDDGDEDSDEDDDDEDSDEDDDNEEEPDDSDEDEK